MTSALTSWISPGLHHGGQSVELAHLLARAPTFDAKFLVDDSHKQRHDDRVTRSSSLPQGQKLTSLEDDTEAARVQLPARFLPTSCADDVEATGGNSQVTSSAEEMMSDVEDREKDVQLALQWIRQELVRTSRS